MKYFICRLRFTENQYILMFMVNKKTTGVRVRVKVALITILILVIGLVTWIGFDEYKNSINRDGYIPEDRKTGEWLTYKEGTWPFIFDYPKNWIITEEKGALYLSGLEDEVIMSISYVKMPPGLSRGVSLCQVKRSDIEGRCSYIDNDFVGHFFGVTDTNEWTGVLKNPDADIRLKLISKNKQNRDLLMSVANSIQPR